MLVTVGARKQSNDSISIWVQKPQSSAQTHKRYSSVAEVSTVLATLGIPVEAVSSFLKLLPNLDENAHWSFAPLDVPQHTLAEEFPDWKLSS
jgi:hypothetical protein